MGEKAESRKPDQKYPRGPHASNGSLNNGRERPDKGSGTENGRMVAVASLKSIPEVLKILESVGDASREDVHAAINEILRGYPGHKRREALSCLRWVRRDRGQARWRHVVWSEEDLGILQTGYAKGLAGIRQARKILLTRHPDWNGCVLDYKAAELGIITNHMPKAGRWPESQENELLCRWGELSVRQMARKLGRSEAAVRNRLCLFGAPGKARLKHGCTLRQTAFLLGVGRTTVRRYVAWDMLHVSRAKNGYGTIYISHANLEKFYREHPEKVKTPERAREMFELWRYDKAVERMKEE